MFDKVMSSIWVKDTTSPLTVKTGSKLAKPQTSDKSACNCIIKNPSLLAKMHKSWLTEQAVKMLSVLRDSMLWPLQAIQGPDRGHSTLFLPFSQCCPCLHPSATEAEATQVTYKGTESLTKWGGKGQTRTAGLGWSCGWELLRKDWTMTK